MTPSKFTALWFVIIAAFAGYGFFGPGHSYQSIDGPFSLETALAPAVSYGALGFCVATSVVVGLIVNIGVRTHGAAKWKGISILAISAVASSILPPLIMALSGLYHGESGLLILFQAIWTLSIAALSFIIWSVSILCISKR
jgi:hypothetical protein